MKIKNINFHFPLGHLNPTSRVLISLTPFFLLVASRSYLPTLASVTPAVFHYPVVFLSTWLGGFIPGLLSTVFCTIYGIITLRPHLLSDINSDPAGFARTNMFFFTCLLFTSLVARLQIALRKSENETALRDGFISMASHEMKTPLTSIKLGLEVIKNDIREKNQEIPSVIKMLERQTYRQEKLIDSMLDLTLIETGQLSLWKEECELSSIVEKASLRAKESLNEGELTFKLSSVKGHWDKQRIEQVIYNLVHNAIRYGDKKPVIVSLEENGNMAVILVMNEGFQIPEKNRAKIFKKFERPVLHSQVQGMGTGLFLARYMTELHGGELQIVNSSGAETIFKVSLPLT